MAGDQKSMPHSKSTPFKHIYICTRAPELSILFERKGEIREKKGISYKVERDRSLGFIRMSIGGVYQTNKDEEAEYIEGMEWFGNVIKKVTHDELTKMLLAAAPDSEKVNTGPLGTTAGGKPEPAAPAEEAPRNPVAATIRGIGSKNT